MMQYFFYQTTSYFVGGKNHVFFKFLFSAYFRDVSPTQQSNFDGFVCFFFLISFSWSKTVIYQLLSLCVYRFYVKNYPRKLYLFSFYSARLGKILSKKGDHLLYLKTILFKLKILKKIK